MVEGLTLVGVTCSSSALSKRAIGGVGFRKGHEKRRKKCSRIEEERDKGGTINAGLTEVEVVLFRPPSLPSTRLLNSEQRFVGIGVQWNGTYGDTTRDHPPTSLNVSSSALEGTFSAMAMQMFLRSASRAKTSMPDSPAGKKERVET